MTTGNPNIDYYWGLDTEGSQVGGEEPAAAGSRRPRTHYSEQLVRMGHMSTAAFAPVS